MISVKIISKKYNRKEVLKDISVNFEQGKAYGIVGENGAGKTTFFKCITGLEKYDGTITATLSPLKNHLGYLATESYYFDKITGLEYLRLLTNARNIEIDNFQDKNIFGLPLQEYVSSYSTGMKKKLALTAILLQNNHYFILDEPFNGVDIQSNLIITDIIKELKKLNKIILISSHIFSTLKDTCDEILVLQNGKLNQRVTVSDFDQLEKELRHSRIGNLIEKLELK